MTKKSENDYQVAEYEYAFDVVPQGKRKSLLSLTLVLAGYPIALSNFVIGGQVGAGLSFFHAFIALLVGNAVLISIVTLTGLIAFKAGLSTSFLAKRAFGKTGSYIFSLLLTCSAVTWVSLNGDIFSRLIKTTFSWWPLSIALTSVFVIMMWMLSAVMGYRGLQIVSSVGVPAAIILSVYGMFKVGTSTDGFAGLLSYVPEAPLTFTVATSAIIGGWIFGATITPDVCRYAKRKSHVYFAALVSFIMGCFGFQLAGAVLAISTGQGDFALAMTALGMGFVAFLTSVFCLWTTQDNNIYAASLALQNIIKDTSYYGKVKHKHIAFAIACLAAIFAAGGIYSYIIPIVSFLAILIPPVVGIILTQEYFVQQEQTERMVNNTALFAWFAGGLLSYIALKTNFFVPPLIGMFTAGGLYYCLEKLPYSITISIKDKREQGSRLSSR